MPARSQHGRGTSRYPYPGAFVARAAEAVSGPAAGSTAVIGLMGHDQSGAEKVLAELRDALEQCTSCEGGGSTTVKTTEAHDAGDETVAFRPEDLATLRIERLAKL
ncbi:hypothetical protein ACWD4G_14200 [Streptomyces sp. NPDC002643]